MRKRITVAAEALQVSDEVLRNIIDRDPQLRAAYGSTGKTNGPSSMPKAPTHAEIMERDPDDLPDRSIPGEGTSVELIQLVSAAERELHVKGLKALEVNEKTIEKIRRLDGLASSTGAFIAMGLENTHRLYYLSICELKTVADQIKERYLDPEHAVSDEDRPYYYRNYIDAVKEFGRAYDSFLNGAAILLKLVGGSSDDDAKKKPTRATLKLGRTMKRAEPAHAKN